MARYLFERGTYQESPEQLRTLGGWHAWAKEEARRNREGRHQVCGELPPVA